MKLLVTGSAGFVAGYLVQELLAHGHEVVGIDNYSKYGRVEKSYDHDPHYHFVEGDCKDTALMKELVEDCDQVVAVAAMIGGITYFHTYAYSLLAENERITAATFDAAVWAHKHKHLQKINVLSSSMVYECAKGMSGNARRHFQPMGSRSWHVSILQKGRGNSTACLIRLSARLTA